MRKNFIKTTIREFLNENNLDFKYDALQFIKDYLDIKSEISLKHTTKNFDTESMSQQMASVGFSDNNNYTINIDFNDTKFGFVRRLAHELVHVKQMEDGRLKVMNNKVYFDGHVYTNDDYKILYHSDEIPKFEEEAFEQERLIANLYWKNK